MVRKPLGRLLRVAMVSVIGVAMWSAVADDYSTGWAPAVGSPMPVLQAPDHSGVKRTLADLSGDQGLLLFLNRSADW